MAKSFNKRLSSFTFSLQKAYERLLTAKPSLFVVSIIIVGATLFLMGGGVYDILVRPLVAFISQSGDVIAFYPGLNDQFILGSLIIMILYALGFVGFMIAYRSTKYAYNPRQAYRFLLIGFAFILIAYFLVEQRIANIFG